MKQTTYILLSLLLLTLLPVATAWSATGNEPSMSMMASTDSVVSFEQYHSIRQQERKADRSLPRLDRLRVGTSAVRINLFRWATFTPEVTWVGHWSKHWDASVSLAWTSASWQKFGRRYALWKVESEFRRYVGKRQRWYWSFDGSIGQSHYKFTDNGREGWVWGTGIGGGYQWRLSARTSIDLHIGAGYNGAYMQRYDLLPYFEGQTPQRTYRDSRHYDYWGVNQLGINLVWELGHIRGRHR